MIIATAALTFGAANEVPQTSACSVTQVLSTSVPCAQSFT